MTPLAPHPEGVAARLRVSPGSRTTGFGGVVDTGGGKYALKVSLNAAPEKGKANKQLLSLLAKAWGLPKSSLSLLSGETSSIKVVLARGDADALMERLSGWLDALAPATR